MTGAEVVTAVIVLYEKTPDESEALASLQRICMQHPASAAQLRLVLYDNSRVAQDAPQSGLPWTYVHDPSNGGLAAAYNHTLALALQSGSTWMLLLDQDTTLTAEYLAEMLATTSALLGDPSLAAIVPILTLQGRVYSPEADFFYHLRHQFRYMRYYPVPRDTAGRQTRMLNAYNSGAALRVEALQSIGGFPADFQLDYLDHAVFFQLHRRGWAIFILQSALEQKLSHQDLDAVSLARHTSVLQSQSLFVARYGSLPDRWLYRLWLLRRSRDYRALCRDARVWQGMVRQALGKWQLPARVRAR